MNVDEMRIEELVESAIKLMTKMTVIQEEMRLPTRRREIHGGVFGGAAYHMTSHTYKKAGLDAVTYGVVHNETGCLVSSAPTQAEAFHEARILIAAASASQLSVLLGRAGAEIRAAREERRLAAERRQEEWIAAQQQVTPIKTIPKRRQRIFEASDGKCHYCGTALTLDGRWHIEHKMPRALLGGSEQHNLVASCVTCNLRKSDMTDLEFQAKLKGVAA